jgi:undecaprenyl-diphosphatase
MSLRTRYKQHVINVFKLITIEVGAILLAFFLSLALVVIIVKRIILLKTEWFDEAVFSFLKKHVSNTATSVLNTITFLGSHYFLIPAFLVLMIHSYFIKRDKWLAIRIAAISISSVLLMLFLKFIFQRPRPLLPLLNEARGLSFPSGHAFMSFSFFGLLIYIIYEEMEKVWLKWLIISLIVSLILSIGLSRVYLRVHYASDVVAGLCMGFMWIVISLSVIHLMEKRKNKLPAV